MATIPPDPRIGEEPIMPTNTISLHGTAEQTLERFKIRELAEGFALHRDAAEWSKLRALFMPEGYVCTTWSAARPIDSFIEVSKAGIKKGAFIMHRTSGTSVELPVAGPAAGKRATAKMKAQITQRFTLPGGQVDIDCDNRFVFFVMRDGNGEWRIRHFRIFYEKDKIVPVIPSQVPHIPASEFEGLAEGYKHLAWGQRKMGYDPLLDLPQKWGDAHDELYGDIKDWLEGKDVEIRQLADASKEGK